MFVAAWLAVSALLLSPPLAVGQSPAEPGDTAEKRVAADGSTEVGADGQPLQAARPAATGLEAAAALERALTAAISAGEKSVVAIARVDRSNPEDAAPIELRQNPFGTLQFPIGQPKPGDVDFIADDYGTGVVIDRSGLIVTHYHVVGPNSDLYVTTAARKVYPARIKAADPRSDLAVLSIDAHDLVPMRFGDATTLKKGQIVVSLGNPYGIARDGQVSASWGIVSNLSRKAPAPKPDLLSTPTKTTLHQFGTLIQTDAKLNLGTSGGALMNLQGEMIGLTTALAAVTGYEQAAGYAVPVDQTFRRALDALKQGREVEYGFLGVSPENFTPAEILAGKQGVRVREVVRGTPAQRYGLQPEDVITHVNGAPIYDQDGLVLEVGKLPVDATVRLTVEREGQVLPMSLTLAKYWVPGKRVVTTPAPVWRGIRVDYATATKDFQEQARQNLVDLDGCVVITEVERDTPSWNEGLRPQMFISHVGGTRVATPKEFRAATEGKSGPLSLRVLPPSDRPQRVIPE